MKRMSEVFRLPLNAPIPEDDCVFNSKGSFISEFKSRAEAEHAAHAINHVDALADALESMMNEAWLQSELLADEFDKIPAVKKAKAALKAYRGEK